MHFKSIFSCVVLGAVSLSSAQMSSMGSRYGGPVYMGAPNLQATSSLVAAGGGPGNFSFAKAITSMAGAAGTKAELGKLTKQYGKERVAKFVEVFDFAVNDACGHAMDAGAKFPAPMVKGKALLMALIKAGMAKDGTFYAELDLDKALSHKIHMQVMDDIDSKFGEPADQDYHRISNQAHYDIGKMLKIRGIRLAKLH